MKLFCTFLLLTLTASPSFASKVKETCEAQVKFSVDTNNPNQYNVVPESISAQLKSSYAADVKGFAKDCAEHFQGLSEMKAIVVGDDEITAMNASGSQTVLAAKVRSKSLKFDAKSLNLSSSKQELDHKRAECVKNADSISCALTGSFVIRFQEFGGGWHSCWPKHLDERLEDGHCVRKN